MKASQITNIPKVGSAQATVVPFQAATVPAAVAANETGIDINSIMNMMILVVVVVMMMKMMTGVTRDVGG